MTAPAYTRSGSQIPANAIFNFLGPTAAPIAAIPIGEVVTGSLGGAKRDTVMVTNFQSNQVAEKKGTVLDPGQLKITYNRLPNDAAQNALLTAFTTGGVYGFSIQLPPDLDGGQETTGDLITLNGVITDGPSNFNIDFTKQITCDITIDITGLPVRTAGE